MHVIAEVFEAGKHAIIVMPDAKLHEVIPLFTPRMGVRVDNVSPSLSLSETARTLAYLVPVDDVGIVNIVECSAVTAVSPKRR